MSGPHYWLDGLLKSRLSLARLRLEQADWLTLLIVDYEEALPRVEVWLEDAVERPGAWRYSELFGEGSHLHLGFAEQTLNNKWVVSIASGKEIYPRYSSSRYRNERTLRTAPVEIQLACAPHLVDLAEEAIKVADESARRIGSRIAGARADLIAELEKKR